MFLRERTATVERLRLKFGAVTDLADVDFREAVWSTLQESNVRLAAIGPSSVRATCITSRRSIDFSYLNFEGTFYSLCSILDGASRFIVHWEIHQAMKEADAEQQRFRGLPGVRQFHWIGLTRLLFVAKLSIPSSHKQ